MNALVTRKYNVDTKTAQEKYWNLQYDTVCDL